MWWRLHSLICYEFHLLHNRTRRDVVISTIASTPSASGPLLLLVCTVLLRRRIREVFDIPGSIAGDICCSLWPFCAPMTITKMDRIAASKFPDEESGAGREGELPPPPTSSGTTGEQAQRSWPSPLFFFTINDLPVLCCSCDCAWFMQTRLCVRLEKGGEHEGSVRRTSFGLLLLFLLTNALFLASEITTALVTSVMLLLAYFVCALLSAAITAVLRGRLRARLGIDGSIERDALLSCFCHSCVLTQMNRVSEALLVSSSGGGEGIQPLQSPTTGGGGGGGTAPQYPSPYAQQQPPVMATQQVPQWGPQAPQQQLQHVPQWGPSAPQHQQATTAWAPLQQQQYPQQHLQPPAPAGYPAVYSQHPVPVATVVYAPHSSSTAHYGGGGQGSAALVAAAVVAQNDPTV